MFASQESGLEIFNESKFQKEEQNRSHVKTK